MIWGEELFTFAPPTWDQPNHRYRFREGDWELLPGLRVIETSGHVRGHQSVLVSLPKTGKVLLTIDAVSEAWCFTRERVASPTDEDAQGVCASTIKLLDLVAHEKVALVVFGHDAEQWQTLKKAPAYLE